MLCYSLGSTVGRNFFLVDSMVNPGDNVQDVTHWIALVLIELRFWCGDWSKTDKYKTNKKSPSPKYARDILCLVENASVTQTPACSSTH